MSNLALTDWREERRRRACELQQQGWSQREIAEAFGVSEAAVSQWMARARDDESAGWRTVQRPGRPRRLSAEELRLLPDRLSHGAEAYGFLGDVWTCARIAVVIRREFGVSYHKAHVSRLLKRVRWTPQIPIERAEQRDEDAIERWRLETWPTLKKRRAARA
jgi:transposase